MCVLVTSLCCFSFRIKLLHQLRTLSPSKFHWWITVMINWNIWKIISLVLWSNVYTYISFFIDFYQEVICYSLTNFSRWQRTTCGPPVICSWFLTSRYTSYVGWQNNTTFFFTNFAWKTSLDPSRGKHLCLTKHLTTSTETRIMSPREWAYKNLVFITTASHWILFRSMWSSSFPFVYVNWHGRRDVSGRQQP